MKTNSAKLQNNSQDNLYHLVLEVINLLISYFVAQNCDRNSPRRQN